MILLVWATATHAETLTGRVIGISDGDTITVLVAKQQVKVRLADIDAPESKQPFGSRSKQALSDLLTSRWPSWNVWYCYRSLVEHFC